MKIRPLYDRVLVKRLAHEETTKGGIIIPDTAKEKPLEGVVHAVGLGRRNKNGEFTPMPVKEGDRVLFAKYGGTEIKIDGEDLIVLREEDLLAVLG
jgi:chaperonin GroES